MGGGIKWRHNLEGNRKYQERRAPLVVFFRKKMIKLSLLPPRTDAVKPLKF